MAEIHAAYQVEGDYRAVTPGEILFGAKYFLERIPMGESIVAIDDDRYVYDPKFLVKGQRFYKVRRADWNNKVNNAWLFEGV